MKRDLCDMLKKYRHDNALTQQELADKLGVSKQMVSLIEHHKVCAGSKVLKRIAYLLELPIIEVVTANVEQSIVMDRIKSDIKNESI